MKWSTKYKEWKQRREINKYRKMFSRSSKGNLLLLFHSIIHQPIDTMKSLGRSIKTWTNRKIIRIKMWKERREIRKMVKTSRAFGKPTKTDVTVAGSASGQVRDVMQEFREAAARNAAKREQQSK